MSASSGSSWKERNVIVDGHNYCVPQIDATQGYPTLAAKMRAVQAELGGHHQPVWRLRDRAPSDNSTLIDPATGELREVEWTRDLGRLAWRVDGRPTPSNTFLRCWTTWSAPRRS